MYRASIAAALTAALAIVPSLAAAQWWTDQEARLARTSRERPIVDINTLSGSEPLSRSGAFDGTNTQTYREPTLPYYTRTAPTEVRRHWANEGGGLAGNLPDPVGSRSTNILGTTGAVSPRLSYYGNAPADDVSRGSQTPSRWDDGVERDRERWETYMPDKYERFITARRNSEQDQLQSSNMITEDGVIGTDYDVPLSYNYGQVQARQRMQEALRPSPHSGWGYRTWPADRTDLSNPNSNPYHQELRWWDADVRQDVEDGVVNVETFAR